MSYPLRNASVRIGVWSLLVVVAASVAYPFLIMLSGTLKSDVAITTDPLNLIPPALTLDNVLELFERIPFARQFLNSLVIAATTSGLATFVCSVVAFGFARFDFKFKHALFIAVLATLMVPPQLLLVPQFKMFQAFGWLDTYYPLILPNVATAFGVFLVRQVMVGVPRELYESARMDGCSEWGVFWRIAVPLSKSGIGILALLTFMNSWNDFVTPLIYLQTEERYTLSVGLASLSNFYNVTYGVPFAGALLSALPMLVLLIVVGQRFFMEGLTTGAVKG